MKKTYLFIAVLIAAIFSTNAQTDVTSTYISNSNFDSGYDYAAAATGNLATGATSKKALSGWTATSGTNSCAGVFEYGTAATFNSATVPDKNYAEATAGGCIAFSNGWGESLVYTTTDEITLPVGTYKFIYAANNRIAMPMGASRFGFVPTSGTAKYTSRVASSYFALNTWVADTVTFTIATPTPGRFSIGYVAVAGVGSGSSAKLCVDFVKLLIMPVDKTSLQSLLTTANSMKANPQPVGTSTAYADLDAAITAAQTVYDNASATAPEVIAQETALNAAIAKVNSAILLYQRISTWTTLPYDATSVIVNPTVEGTSNSVVPNGWTVTKGNGNTFTATGQHYSAVSTNRYFDSWNGTAGAMLYTAQQTIKDIPNGIYKLKAAARTSGAGSYLYAKTSGSTYRTEIINLGSAGGTLGNGFNTITVEVPVLDNTMTIGVTTDKNVSEGSAWAGTWFSADDFTLSYISDGSPYLLDATESLFFDKITSVRTFTVKGGNLSANATLTAPAGITLDKTSLTPAEVAAGVTVTATHDGATVIASGEIVISTTGAANSIVTVNAQPDNATSAIVNPNFSNGTTGWTATTTAQNKTTATNQNVGAFEGTMPFYENWNGSAYTGKIYQVVNGLPAGRYLLKMGVFANNGGEGLFVYGDNYETAVSNASVPAFFEVEFVTPGGSAEIGLNIKSGTNNWVGIDNVSLKYLGVVSAPLVSVSATNILLTEANLSKTFTLTGANLTADVSLVSSVAGVTVLPATISKDDAELATGKTVTVTFDPAATGAGSLTGTITVSTAGVDDKVIAVATSKDSECFTPLGSVNLIPDPYLNSLAPFAGWGHKSVVTGAEAYCGLSSVKFEATTNTYPDGAALDVNGIVWESNSTYRVRAMVKSVDGTFAFFAKATDPDVTISIPQSNNEWVLIDQTFTTGANPGTNFFSFNNVDGASTGKVAFIDNWELFKVSPSTSVSTLKSDSKLNAFVQNGRVVANFEANADGVAELVLYNIQGVQLTKVNASIVKGQNQYTFNAELPSGVYVIKMSENNNTTAVKVVK